MKNKIILDLCGGTGSWSKPYKDAGYDVRLITLPDNDVRTYVPPANVYGILSAPPCTKFSKAGWQVKKQDRDFREGMECVRACLEIIWKIQENGVPLAFWALENPHGYLSKFLGKPAFSFQHWQFGETNATATKRTAIWGYFNEPKKKTKNERTVPLVYSTVRTRALAKIPTLFGHGGRNQNPEWSKSSVEERAKTCAGFAQAFYKANL